jgi:hypothetical protein
MKNIIVTICLLAMATLSAQKSHEGTWKCDYSDMPVGIEIIKKDWLKITTFKPNGEIDLVEIYVKNNKQAERAEKYANRKKLYHKTLVYKKSN